MLYIHPAVIIRYLTYFRGPPAKKEEVGKFINSRRNDMLRSCGLTSSINISYLRGKKNWFV